MRAPTRRRITFSKPARPNLAAVARPHARPALYRETLPMPRTPLPVNDALVLELNTCKDANTIQYIGACFLLGQAVRALTLLGRSDDEIALTVENLLAMHRVEDATRAVNDAERQLAGKSPIPAPKPEL